MASTTIESSEYEYETKDEVKEATQYKTTVPKSLVEAMGWDGGEKVEWEIVSSNKLSIEKKDE